MEINYIHPPNRQMNTTFVPTVTPTMYKDTIFMDFASDGRLLVGSANVTATFWQGALQVYQNYDDYTLGKYESYYNSPIIFDGKFFSNNKQIVSESESKLMILSQFEGDMTKSEKYLSVETCIHHYETIKQISLWKDEHKLLTASDNHISQWDINNTLKLVWDFTDYHTNVITGVDLKHGDSNMFASVSRDRRACIWDIRTEGVATELYSNAFCNLTSVAWCPLDQNVIVVGTQAGNLYLLDVRQPKEFVNVQYCHKKTIHKLQFEVDSMQVAIVGNTNELQVYNAKGNEFSLNYKSSEQHCDHIRDAKWHNNVLFSCGLQSHVVKHSF